MNKDQKIALDALGALDALIEQAKNSVAHRAKKVRSYQDHLDPNFMRDALEDRIGGAGKYTGLGDHIQLDQAIAELAALNRAWAEVARAFQKKIYICCD